MHAIFIPYGIKQDVDLFMKCLETQFFQVQFKKGDETKMIYGQGSLRILPFGVWEYVFPKEYKDRVLTTLGFDKVGKKVKDEFEDRKDRYGLGSVRLAILRKMIKCEKIPEFNTTGKLIWYMNNVEIIPIGVRYDADREETEGELTGFTHEAL